MSEDTNETTPDTPAVDTPRKKKVKKAKPAKDPLANRRDAKGGLIDPPTIPEFEQRLQAAHNSADDLLIRDVSGEYAKAQEDLALKNAKRDAERHRAERDAL